MVNCVRCGKKLKTNEETNYPSPEGMLCRKCYLEKNKREMKNEDKINYILISIFFIIVISIFLSIFPIFYGGETHLEYFIYTVMLIISIVSIYAYIKLYFAILKIRDNTTEMNKSLNALLKYQVGKDIKEFEKSKEKE
jgi:magnesium-transporting ATPase (P-type)